MALPKPNAISVHAGPRRSAKPACRVGGRSIEQDSAPQMFFPRPWPNLLKAEFAAFVLREGYTSGPAGYQTARHASCWTPRLRKRSTGALVSTPALRTAAAVLRIPAAGLQARSLVLRQPEFLEFGVPPRRCEWLQQRRPPTVSPLLPAEGGSLVGLARS